MLLKCEQTVFCMTLFCMFSKPVKHMRIWPEETQLFPNFHADEEGNILHSLHREFGDKHVRSVINRRFKSQQIVWISLIISTTTSGLSRGSYWCPVKLSMFPVLLLWISPDQTTRESRESPLPAGGRLSCCLWNIMCAVNEKVAVLDWAGGFLDTRRHRLMFSLLRWLCHVAVSGTGPDGPELLSAACCFWPVCSRGEDPPDKQSATSAPRFPVCSLLLRIY